MIESILGTRLVPKVESLHIGRDDTIFFFKKLYEAYLLILQRLILMKLGKAHIALFKVSGTNGFDHLDLNDVQIIYTMEFGLVMYLRCSTCLVRRSAQPCREDPDVACMCCVIPLCDYT